MIPNVENELRYVRKQTEYLEVMLEANNLIEELLIKCQLIGSGNRIEMRQITNFIMTATPRLEHLKIKAKTLRKELLILSTEDTGEVAPSKPNLTLIQ